MVWIIFLRLAGPRPLHASTSFRGVSLSSMDVASSTICTTCRACWLTSRVVYPGEDDSEGDCGSEALMEQQVSTHLLGVCRCHTSGYSLPRPRPHQSEQPSESADTCPTDDTLRKCSKTGGTILRGAAATCPHSGRSPPSAAASADQRSPSPPWC